MEETLKRLKELTKELEIGNPTSTTVKKAEDIAEDLRIETSKIAEDLRIETSKIAEELSNVRTVAEEARNIAEGARILAEEARDKSEKARVLAEENREKSEKMREEIYMKLKKIFSEL